MNYDFRLKNQSNKLSSRLITSTGAPQEMLSGSSARTGRMHRFRNDLPSILKGRADFLASIDLSAIINHPSAMDQNQGRDLEVISRVILEVIAGAPQCRSAAIKGRQ